MTTFSPVQTWGDLHSKSNTITQLLYFCFSAALLAGNKWAHGTGHTMPFMCIPNHAVRQWQSVNQFNSCSSSCIVIHAQKDMIKQHLGAKWEIYAQMCFRVAISQRILVIKINYCNFCQRAVSYCGVCKEGKWEKLEGSSSHSLILWH